MNLPLGVQKFYTPPSYTFFNASPFVNGPLALLPFRITSVVAAMFAHGGPADDCGKCV